MSVYKRGKVWWIGFTDPNGKWVRKSAGGNKKEAQKALDRIKGKILSGDYEAVDVLAAPPFELAVSEYIRDRIAAGKNESSYEYLESLWADGFKSRVAASITTNEIVRRLDAWHIDRQWSNASRNRVAAQLAGFLSFAIRRDWIKRHPMERGRVPMLDEASGRKRWLRRHEIDLLRASVYELPGIPADWRSVLDDVIVFAASTGVRFGRLCELRPSDYADGFIVIDRDKNGERLHVPIAGDLEPLVDRRVDAADFPASYLFPGPNGGNATSSIRRWLPKVVRAAGLVWGKYKRGEDGKPLRDRLGNKVLDPDGITFHSLRHSFASNAFLNGVSDPMIRRLGNWKDSRMLDRYRHLGDEQLREAAACVVAGISDRHNSDTTLKTAEARTEAS